MSPRFFLAEAWRSIRANAAVSVAATVTVLIAVFILGAFIVVAFKESWHNKHPRELTPDPVDGITDVVAEDEEIPEPLTTMIVRPTLEAQALASAGTTETNNTTSTLLAPADAVAEQDEKEVVAK